MRFPLLSKASALVAVTAGLMWSLWSVQSIVQERQQRQNEAERSVANSLAGSQILLGPVLTRACTESWVSGRTAGPDPKPVVESRSYSVRLAANQATLDAKVIMTPRYRGMFKVNGYGMTAKVDARWQDTAQLTLRPQHPGATLSCEAPILSVALSDARGIRVADMRVNGQAQPVQPGSGMERYPRGFQSTLQGSSWPASGTLDVHLDLELGGTQSLSLVPLADTTVATLGGDWPHPSFGGRFLPSERQVGDRGFTATWKVTSLASTAQQEWQKDAALCPALTQGDQTVYERHEAGETVRSACVESFGVDFMDPVNPYVQSDRATKYGLLFIVLTFVGVGLVEVLRRLRVHPIQYLLVGAALSLFFLLLVSLSEHMLFMYAYVVASLACTVLLTFYGSFVLGGWMAGCGFGAGIAGMFATLYALLQMEQRALMLGSVVLFVVLTVVMVSTRKLDWYALIAQIRGEDGRHEKAQPEA